MCLIGGDAVTDGGDVVTDGGDVVVDRCTRWRSRSTLRPGRRSQPSVLRWCCSPPSSCTTCCR